MIHALKTIPLGNGTGSDKGQVGRVGKDYFSEKKRPRKDSEEITDEA